MSSIREKYFEIKNLNNKYLPENIILDLLMLVNCITDKTSLIFNFDKECENVDKLDEYVLKITQRYPYQYLINKSSFSNLDLYVDERVLIPRNETELLVNITIDLINKYFPNQSIDIFDVCTGSGCIGLSLKNKFPLSHVYMSDISKDALDVAYQNKVNLNLDVTLLLGDIVTPFISSNLKADVLVSNPPYIPNKDTVSEQTLKYEPHLALFASPSTYFYEQIFAQYQNILKNKFIMTFEIGEDMEPLLIPLCERYFPNDIYEFRKDMDDKTRYLIIIRV